MFKWVSLIISMAALTVAVLYGRWQGTAMNMPESGIVLAVAPGDSVSAIARRLSEMEVLAWPRVFGVHARLAGGDRQIRAGEYEVPPGTTPPDLLEILTRGDVVHYALTFPEGMTIAQVIAQIREDDRLQQSGSLTPDGLVPGYDNPEGWFFPDTYHVPRGMNAGALVQSAHERMQTILAQEWEAREEGLPYKDAYEALIMASIIEKETGLASERAEIAAVFVSRMRLGMRLQTDPTIIYGLGDQFDGNLTRKHLRDGSNPYNTYRIDRLPPTPIALPGRAAINAALHPADSKALYFVAKGDGSHYFSKTLKEHETAVRRYQLQ